MNHPTLETLVDYVHAALPADDDARVHVHLAACADCRTAYRAEVAFGETLRRLARAEERELPTLIRTRIRQATARATRATRLATTVARLRPAIAVPAAAAILFAASLALPGRQTPVARATPIDVRYFLDEHKAQAAGNPLSEHSAGIASFDASVETRAADAIH